MDLHPHTIWRAWTPLGDAQLSGTESGASCCGKVSVAAGPGDVQSAAEVELGDGAWSRWCLYWQCFSWPGASGLKTVTFDPIGEFVAYDSIDVGEGTAVFIDWADVLCAVCCDWAQVGIRALHLYSVRLRSSCEFYGARWWPDVVSHEFGSR